MRIAHRDRTVGYSIIRCRVKTGRPGGCRLAERPFRHQPGSCLRSDSLQTATSVLCDEQPQSRCDEESTFAGCGWVNGCPGAAWVGEAARERQHRDAPHLIADRLWTKGADRLTAARALDGPDFVVVAAAAGQHLL